MMQIAFSRIVTKEVLQDEVLLYCVLYKLSPAPDFFLPRRFFPPRPYSTTASQCPGQTIAEKINPAD